jgi:HK97 family phage portal protein
MSFWSSWFRRERKLTSLELFREIYGGRTSMAGVSVTWQNALEVATVLACCRVIAEGIAQVPWKLYQDRPGAVRVPAVDHPLYNVIYRKPNRWQTSFEFRETIAFHLVLTGNAYVFMGKVGRARQVRELVPLPPELVTLDKRGDVLTYRYQPIDGTSVEFAADTIWHIRGPSWNGYQGMDATKLVKEAIGLAIASESAHAEMHKSGARLSGVYTVEGALSKEKYEFLAAWLDKYAMNGDRAGKAMILDLGAKWTPQSMSGVDAQHLETRKHQIEEICRGFRVMPIMVGFSDKAATYASAEQMFIAHVVHTLAPWYERIEQSGDVALLSEQDQAAGYYTKFTPNALMRGAAKDRAEFYTRMVGSVNATPGIMTINEIRALEELSPIEGGDEIFKPELAAPAAAPASNEGDDAMKQAIGALSKSVEGMAASTKALAEKDTPPPQVTVDVSPPAVTVEGAKIEIQNVIPKRGMTKKVAQFDDNGRISGMIEEEIEDV